MRDAADENGRPGFHGKSVRRCSVRKITASRAHSNRDIILREGTHADNGMCNLGGKREAQLKLS
jgi:hypothetical protein